MLLSNGLCLVADEVFVQLEGNTHVLSVGYVPCLGLTSLKIVELLTECSESDQIPWLLIRVDLYGLYVSGLIQLRHFCIHLSRLILSALFCLPYSLNYVRVLLKGWHIMVQSQVHVVIYH